MSKLNIGKNCVAVRSSAGLPLIEGLETRQFLSAAPVAHLAPLAVKTPPPVVQLSAVGPRKILAGNKPGTEVVTIHNYGTIAETLNVNITLTPSLDGVNPAGTYSTPGVSETLTIAKHGAAHVKVTFVPPITLAAGKYHTIATVDLGGGDVITAVAPGTYTLTLPPAPTTTPSLVGHYVGLITGVSSHSTGFFGGGTSTTIHQLSFIWNTTSQTLTSLTGLFAVGLDQVNNGTMEGYELNNGVIHYTLSSSDMTYTLDGKVVVSASGTKITGKFKGVFVGNLFPNLGGSFKLVLQPS